jgi:hypothetical protein
MHTALPSASQAYALAERLNLLQYLAPGISIGAQNVVLVVGAGVPVESFAHAPGLANTTRTAKLFEEAEQKKRIVRDAVGRYRAKEPEEITPGGRDRVLRRKGVQATLAFLAHPRRDLILHGLSGMAAVLDDEQARCLADLNREAVEFENQDRVRARYRKTARFTKVIRRVPEPYFAASGTQLRNAPTDVEERVYDLLSAGSDDEPWRKRLRGEVHRLYWTVLARGEGPLAHWMRIVEEVAATHPVPEERVERMYVLLSSYLARRWELPPGLSEYAQDRKQLQRDSPVPECGFGPWVVQEEQLLQCFYRRFAPAMGPLCRDLYRCVRRRLRPS